jgi:hypothetical protein
LLETHTAVTRNGLIAPSGNLHQNTLFLRLKDFPLRCENPALKDHLKYEVLDKSKKRLAFVPELFLK